MKILAIGAHLDDIELACGGTLSKAINNGHQVKALIMSKSGYKNMYGEVKRSDDTAVLEGTNALNTLGITDISILDFPTKDIEFNSVVVEEIEKIINDFDPDIIFTHHPIDTHQAHVGTSKSTIAASRRRNNIFFYEPVAPSGRSYIPFKPQLYVDITSTVRVKSDSLRAHRSEYSKFGGESFIEAIEGRSRFRGYEIGVEHAEVFEILRSELGFTGKCSLI